MAIITRIKDKLGRIIYPKTVTDAVYDSNNTKLSTTLNEINQNISATNEKLIKTKMFSNVTDFTLKDINDKFTSDILKRATRITIICFYTAGIRFSIDIPPVTCNYNRAQMYNAGNGDYLHMAFNYNKESGTITLTGKYNSANLLVSNIIVDYL